MTDFAQDIFYFSYAQQAWTLAQILFEIGQKVYKNLGTIFLVLRQENYIKDRSKD